LEQISGDWKDEIAALKKTYPDRTSLHAVLDENADTSVTNLAKSMKLDDKRVFEFLGASLSQTTEPLVGGWLSQHWADLFLIAGVGTLMTLPALGPKSDFHIARLPCAIANHDLLPYVAVQAQDLDAKNTKSNEDAEKLLSGFIGRAPLELISKGQTISTEQLIDKEIVLTDAAILRVPLKLRPILEGRSLPAAAELLLSNRGTPSSGEVCSIVLLKLDADEPTATVAVPRARLLDIAKWISNSDAYVSFSIR
jgi:hypothetical protein